MVYTPRMAQSLEQQIATQGRRRKQAAATYDDTTEKLKPLVRKAIAAGSTKKRVAELANVTRPTLDDWLK